MTSTSAEQHSRKTIWDALTERGFDPGYQEVLVVTAGVQGEHWSWTGDGSDRRHVHLTADENAENYTLRDAGPECPHPDDE